MVSQAPDTSSVQTQVPKRYGGFALIVLAGVITIILIIYPKEGLVPEPDIRITDRMFWPRVIILTLISIFALLCFVFMFIFHWTEPVYAKPIKSKRF